MIFDPTYYIVQYFVLLGRRTAPNAIATLPPESMGHVLLKYLTKFPHNMSHYLLGCNYMQKVLLSGGQSGLQVSFVFNDSLDNPRFEKEISKGVNVFLICTENDEEIAEMNVSLSRICSKNCIFWIKETKKEKFIMPRVITCENEFWDYMLEYAQPVLSEVDDSLCVPLCGGDVKFPYFNPANITFYTLSSALGNWGVGTKLNSKEEKKNISEKSREALSDMYAWSRQEKSVDIISQLFSLCHVSFKHAPKDVMGLSDQNYPPLMIAAPYTNKDVREIFKFLSRSEQFFQDVDKVVELEQTPNYCFDINTQKVGSDFQKTSAFLLLFISNRLDFLDLAANLHCSFRFSPYLRLPLICKSINLELSYVGAKNNMQLAYSKDRQAYDKAIHKVGDLLASKLLAPKTIKMLENMPTQIVVMTDLPLEWMEVNGVPLGFSHDVCRIPETPASGMLTHYGVARMAAAYKIPKDILKKTLIVYGCREDSFKEWQDKADFFADRLGAKTAVCQSLDEFENTIKRYKPELLIIDAHGGTDLAQHQSYIKMGEERVYPKDISDRGISSRLVFISACNTAPCYNDVNTVANAFLETGAFSITCSYLPLDIEESSTLYIRILNQLDIAARKCIHRNWLAFVSHMLRTSFIMTPFVESVQGDNPQPMDPMLMGKVNAISMVFENRADLYRQLRAGEEVAGLKYDFSQAIPHYLMYTTIGRADLVEFESFTEIRREAYQKMTESIENC